jgi:uncharacterized membrane protein
MNIKEMFIKKRNVVIFALFATIVWGIDYLCIKICYQLFSIEKANLGPKLLLAGARFMLTGLIGLFSTFVIGKKNPFIINAKPLQLLNLSLFQTVIQYSILYIGLVVNIDVGKSSILNQFGSFLLVVCSQIFSEMLKCHFVHNAFKAQYNFENFSLQTCCPSFWFSA